MTDPGLPCPVCSAPCHRMGPVYHPNPPLVAGVPIDLGQTAFELQRCAACGFIFKNPPIPEDKLRACYAGAQWFHWEDRPDPLRRQFDLYRDLAAAHAPGRRVLDIGCFNGAMLEYFGAEWDRYGVEPSEAAARVAGERGVKVLGATVDAAPPGLVFDAIISVDVAEHIADPVPFFRSAAERLAPGGALVTVTGDTGTLPWRTAGSLNWYAALPEHVSFFGERTMRTLADMLGLRSVLHRRVSHARTGAGRKLEQLGKNALFLSLNRVRGLGIPALQERFVRHRAPGWWSSRDHMIHIMQRP